MSEKDNNNTGNNNYPMPSNVGASAQMVEAIGKYIFRISKGK